MIRKDAEIILTLIKLLSERREDVYYEFNFTHNGKIIANRDTVY